MAIAYKLAKEKYGRDIVVIDQVLRLRLNTIENDWIQSFDIPGSFIFLKFHTLFRAKQVEVLHGIQLD